MPLFLFPFHRAASSTSPRIRPHARIAARRELLGRQDFPRPAPDSPQPQGPTCSPRADPSRAPEPPRCTPRAPGHGSRGSPPLVQDTSAQTLAFLLLNLTPAFLPHAAATGPRTLLASLFSPKFGHHRHRSARKKHEAELRGNQTRSPPPSRRRRRGGRMTTTSTT